MSDAIVVLKYLFLGGDTTQQLALIDHTPFLAITPLKNSPVTLDLTIPTIVNLFDGYFEEDVIFCKGIAYPNNAPNTEKELFSFVGSDSQPLGHPFSGQYSFILDKEILEPGDYKVVITCTDRAGNIGKDTTDLTVNFKPEEQELLCDQKNGDKCCGYMFEGKTYYYCVYSDPDLAPPECDAGLNDFEITDPKDFNEMCNSQPLAAENQKENKLQLLANIPPVSHDPCIVKYMTIIYQAKDGKAENEQIKKLPPELMKDIGQEFSDPKKASQSGVPGIGHMSGHIVDPNADTKGGLKFNYYAGTGFIVIAKIKGEDTKLCREYQFVQSTMIENNKKYYIDIYPLTLTDVLQKSLLELEKKGKLRSKDELESLQRSVPSLYNSLGKCGYEGASYYCSDDYYLYKKGSTQREWTVTYFNPSLGKQGTHQYTTKKHNYILDGDKVIYWYDRPGSIFLNNLRRSRTKEIITKFVDIVEDESGLHRILCTLDPLGFKAEFNPDSPTSEVPTSLKFHEPNCECIEQTRKGEFWTEINRWKCQ